MKRYVDGDTQTVTFRFSDGVAQGLVGKRILHRPTSLSKVHDYFDYNMHPWAYSMLKQNPQLLAGASKSQDADEDL